jgi:hypothetical protein
VPGVREEIEIFDRIDEVEAFAEMEKQDFRKRVGAN